MTGTATSGDMLFIDETSSASALAVYYLHGENARLCLHGPAHVVSDYAEVIGAIEDVMLNETMIEVLDRLYWDKENNRPKAGLRGQSPYVDGSYRRFVNKTYGFYAQHYQTYDFWTMKAQPCVLSMETVHGKGTADDVSSMNGETPFITLPVVDVAFHLTDLPSPVILPGADGGEQRQ